MRHIALLAAAIGLTGGLAGSQEQDSKKRIDELIRQLGADEYAAREKATQELKKIGKPAEEALKKAAESPDPEVRARAKAILGDLAAPPNKSSAGKSEETPRRGAPGQPGFGFRFGGRGSSVQITSVNGDSTYKITPTDGEPITFRKTASGGVKLEYKDEKGDAKTVEAESLEKFLKDHEDLAKKYGISQEGIDYGGARASFRGNPLGLRGVVPPGAFGFRFQGGREGLENRAAGATLEEVSGALRSQLGIPEGQGLVVKGVSEGSDAEAAGLKKSDILLEVDGKKVASVKDVKDGLRRSSSLTVLRKGQRETLKPPEKKDY